MGLKYKNTAGEWVPMPIPSDDKKLDKPDIDGANGQVLGLENGKTAWVDIQGSSNYKLVATYDIGDVTNFTQDISDLNLTNYLIDIHLPNTNDTGTFRYYLTINGKNEWFGYNINRKTLPTRSFVEVELLNNYQKLTVVSGDSRISGNYGVQNDSYREVEIVNYLGYPPTGVHIDSTLSLNGGKILIFKR